MAANKISYFFERQEEDEDSSSSSTNDEDEYEVEKVLNHRFKSNKMWYKVKWSRYDEEEWLPYDQMNCDDLVDLYWGHPSKVARMTTVCSPPIPKKENTKKSKKSSRKAPRKPIDSALSTKISDQLVDTHNPTDHSILIHIIYWAYVIFTLVCLWRGLKLV